MGSGGAAPRGVRLTASELPPSSLLMGDDRVDAIGKSVHVVHPATTVRPVSGYALVLIGGGNMGAALLTGLMGRPSAAHGTGPGTGLAVVEIEPQRRAWLRDAFSSVSVLDEIPTGDAAIVATKPDGAADAARRAAAAGARRVLSIAAGVTTSTLDDAVGPDVAVVRAMPNLAALVGRGAAAVTAGASATEDDLVWAESILGSVGRVDRLDESDFDAFTALAGSGPGYLFAVAEHLVAAGVEADLPAPLATDIVRSLFAGVAELLGDDGDPAELRRRVTSPGGTTEAGLAVLTQRDLRAALVDAVAAAAARSRELG